MRGRWLLLVLLLALLAGCGRSTGSGPLVKWRRTGGIAGLDQGVAIAPTGEVQAQTSGKLGPLRRLTEPEAERLTALLAAVKPEGLRPGYTDPQVADALFESLFVQSATDHWETQVGTGGSAPPEVGALLQFLAELYERHRPQ